jgi:hypothetical protein
MKAKVVIITFENGKNYSVLFICCQAQNGKVGVAGATKFLLYPSIPRCEEVARVQVDFLWSSMSR